MIRLLLYIFELVAAVLFLKALGRSFRGVFNPRIHIRTAARNPQPDQPAETHRGAMARDPVCGMFVSTELSHQLTRGAETVHFCSRDCLERYQKENANVASR